MPMFRRALFATVVVLVALTFVPSQLAAHERETPAGVRVSASTLDWFSAAWSELSAWLQRPIAAAPLTGIWARTGMCIDPYGRPSPCPPKPQQGGCAVDGSCTE